MSDPRDLLARAVALYAEIEARYDATTGRENDALDEALTHMQHVCDQIGAACRATGDAPAYVPPTPAEIAKMWQAAE